MEFTLKRASDLCYNESLEEKINIDSIEDLKAIFDKYQYKKEFGKRLVIDFKYNEITIYDYYIE